MAFLLSLLILRHILGCGASRTSFYLSSHTRLRQLADFPSLILRSSFAQPSLKVRSAYTLNRGWKIEKIFVYLQSKWV